MAEDRYEMRQIQTPVQGMERGRRDEAGERERQVVHVAMDHIEVPGALEHLPQLDHVRRELILRPGIETEAPDRGSHELPGGLRVTGREQGNGVAAAD